MVASAELFADRGQREFHDRADEVHRSLPGQQDRAEPRFADEFFGLDAECGSDFAIWDNGRVGKLADHTVAEIRERLPEGYGLNTTPQIDLASMSGKGAAWTRGDADCCPSATIGFKLRLDGTELHVEDMEFRKNRSGS